jgi:hypothetical protein
LARVELKKTELEEHLKEQIEVLLASCEDYDNGRNSEANKYVTPLRNNNKDFFSDFLKK